MTTQVEIILPCPHAKQQDFIECKAKRKVIRAGRRGGKTIGIAIMFAKEFLAGRRCLYTAPTYEQTEAFWNEIKNIFADAIQARVFLKNEAMKTLEKPGTHARIKAKTAWNADTMRGDFADLLAFDEWQLTNEDAWEIVGLPMLADNNGDAVFIYTPPSLYSMGTNRSRDPRHAAEMFKGAQAEEELAAKEEREPKWRTFHWTSWDNPYVSREGLAEITRDMSSESMRREIMAEDDEVQQSWLVYPQWNPGLRTVPRFQIPKEWPIFSGHDFGSANPAAIFAAQNTGVPYKIDDRLSINTRDFVIFREYAPGARTIQQHIAWWEEYTRGYTVVKSVGGNVSTEDEIRQGYTGGGWLIQAPSCNKPNLQIEKTRQLFGLGRVWIMQDCTGLLTQLASMLFKLDESSHPTNDIKDEAKYHLLACFIEGTMIHTEHGLRPIESVRIGDKVLTRKGYQKVMASSITGVKEVVTARFSDGVVLTGTPDHPVFTKNKGFVPLACLRYSDIIETWKENKLHSRESITTDTLPLRDYQTGDISTTKGCISTGLFGNHSTARFLLDIISIIKTAITQIMTYPILNFYPLVTMNGSIIKVNVAPPNLNTSLISSQSLWKRGKGGREPQKVRLTSSPEVKNNGQTESPSSVYASIAGQNILQSPRTEAKDSVRANVSHISAFIAELITRLGFVRAENNLSSTDIQDKNIVLGDAVHCLGINPSGKQPVYNLSVDTVPEYYANGILVHNCLRYLFSEFRDDTAVSRDIHTYRFC